MAMREKKLHFPESGNAISCIIQTHTLAAERWKVQHSSRTRKGRMKILKSVVTSLAVLVTALLTDILANNANFLCGDIRKVIGYGLSADGFIFLLADLAIAVTLCTTVWLMFVWDAGDRVAQIFMLLAGIFGLVMHYLNVFTDLRWQSGFFYDLFNGVSWLSAHWQKLMMGLPWHSMFWVSLFSDPFAYTLHALFIAFAVAGLVTKRKPK
jgi:hypothetical protein